MVRAKEIYDGAIPSGNSVMALNLWRFRSPELDPPNKRHSFFSAFAGFLQNPQGAEVLLQALDFELAPALEIVVCGSPQTQQTQSLLRTVNQRFLPAKVLLNQFDDPDDPILIAAFVENHVQSIISNCLRQTKPATSSRPNLKPCPNNSYSPNLREARAFLHSAERRDRSVMGGPNFQKTRLLQFRQGGPVRKRRNARPQTKGMRPCRRSPDEPSREPLGTYNRRTEPK